MTGKKLIVGTSVILKTAAGMKTPSIVQCGSKRGPAKIPTGYKTSVSCCVALTKIMVANRKSANHLQKTCEVIVGT